MTRTIRLLIAMLLCAAACGSALAQGTINYIVIVVMENRDQDEVFGHLDGVQQYCQGGNSPKRCTNNQSTSCTTIGTHDVCGNGGYCEPLICTANHTSPQDVCSTGDTCPLITTYQSGGGAALGHEDSSVDTSAPQHAQYNSRLITAYGKMNGLSNSDNNPNGGTLAYYDDGTNGTPGLPYLYSLARNYGEADNHFSTVGGPSSPGHCALFGVVGAPPSGQTAYNNAFNSPSPKSGTNTTVAGNYTASGVNITWSSGNNFAAILPGSTIKLAGTAFTVAAAPAPTATTLSVTSGSPAASGVFTSITNSTWSAGSWGCGAQHALKCTGGGWCTLGAAAGSACSGGICVETSPTDTVGGLYTGTFISDSLSNNHQFYAGTCSASASTACTCDTGPCITPAPLASITGNGTTATATAVDSNYNWNWISGVSQVTIAGTTHYNGSPITVTGSSTNTFTFASSATATDTTGTAGTYQSATCGGGTNAPTSCSDATDCGGGNPTCTIGKSIGNTTGAVCPKLTSMADVLDAASVTWKYYNYHNLWNAVNCTEYSYFGADQNNVFNDSQFATDVSNCSANPCTSLPKVSWVSPTSTANSMHGSGGTAQQAETWIKTYVLNPIFNNNNVWSHVIVFITWDDWGGRYDHVPPPVVDNLTLGIRVPLLCVGPYCRNKIVHTQFDFVSIWKCAESTFGAGTIGNGRESLSEDACWGTGTLASPGTDGMVNLSQAPLSPLGTVIGASQVSSGSEATSGSAVQ